MTDTHTQGAIQKMADKILEFVEGYQPASFVELIRHLGQDAVGDYDVMVPTRPKLVQWVNISSLFIEALNLVKDKLFEEPCSYIIYAMDGGMLNLPIATRLDHEEYHWLPTLLRIRTPELQEEIDQAREEKSQKQALQ